MCNLCELPCRDCVPYPAALDEMQYFLPLTDLYYKACPHCHDFWEVEDEPVIGHALYVVNNLRQLAVQSGHKTGEDGYYHLGVHPEFYHELMEDIGARHAAITYTTDRYDPALIVYGIQIRREYPNVFRV